MTLGPRDEHDPRTSLGSRVSRAGTSRVVYLSSADVVDLLDRVDEYIGHGGWEVKTLDRTNDGEFYAFIALTQVL